MAFPVEFILLNLIALAIATIVLTIIRIKESIAARIGSENK